MRIRPVRPAADTLGLVCSLGLGLIAGCADPVQTDLQTDDAPTQLPARAEHAVRQADVDGYDGSSLAESMWVRAAEPMPVQAPGRERYAPSDPAPVQRVLDAPVSTFSIDVDTGSYANVRRLLNGGAMPPADAVRIEEMINYFDYAYPDTATPEQPFSVTTTLAPTPWNTDSELLRIGLRGFDLPADHARSANLVFLVDVSGSMASPDKLGLLRASLSMLARRLDADDRVSIVTYAGTVGTVLDGAAGDDATAIDAALRALTAGGATAGEAGIDAAYRLAARHARDGSINRVILATDGDFNVGQSSTEALLSQIEARREQGIALTTLGFGAGNYNDEMMERLADAGNGNHAYIDTLSEARKVLGEQLDGTLFTIAQDVKIQLEFNPAVVSEYRLIGYENRTLADEDFANDRVDAGDIGSGHTVTALYEIVRTGTPGWLSERRYDHAIAEDPALVAELGELRLRYKLPDDGVGMSTGPSRQLVRTLSADATLLSLDAADDDFRFATAVAAWGEWLRDDRYLRGFDPDRILALARDARGDDPHGFRAGFIELVQLAQALRPHPTLSQRPPGPDEGRG